MTYINKGFPISIIRVFLNVLIFIRLTFFDKFFGRTNSIRFLILYFF